ncbi:MAG: ribosome small subunit-dependent GTPase A [Longimonas sp.]|uniref:ribosome small subunit-dependent GTPase A n=1 Tax=Longimonas sp. TaxID=2039626 RepID=UPI00336165A2
MSSSPTYEGRVLRSTGSWYEVQVDPVDDPDMPRVVDSRIRGKFRLDETDVTNPVAVGDRVTIRYNEDDETGMIIDIHERQNRLSRRAAGRRVNQEHIIVSNIDRAWAVQAVQQPPLNPAFVDRFLVMAGVHDIPAGLVINKMDLMDDEQQAEVADVVARYEALDYPVYCTSATAQAGISDWHAALRDQVNVVTGPSGAGKSSLINAIAPDLDIETKSISEQTQKGRHTTTFAALHPLPDGGHIVDTPGVREFGIVEMHPADLCHFFVEFVPYLDACKFDDCTHDHEPGCAVKNAVDEGAIHPARYESYLSILYSLQDGMEGTGR